MQYALSSLILNYFLQKGQVSLFLLLGWEKWDSGRFGAAPQADLNSDSGILASALSKRPCWLSAEVCFKDQTIWTKPCNRQAVATAGIRWIKNKIKALAGKWSNQERERKGRKDTKTAEWCLKNRGIRATWFMRFMLPFLSSKQVSIPPALLSLDSCFEKLAMLCDSRAHFIPRKYTIKSINHPFIWHMAPGLLFIWITLRTIFISSCIHLTGLPSFHSEFPYSWNHCSDGLILQLCQPTSLWLSWLYSGFHGFFLFFFGYFIMDTKLYDSLTLLFRGKLKYFSSFDPGWNTCNHVVRTNKVFQCSKYLDDWEVFIYCCLWYYYLWDLWALEK